MQRIIILIFFLLIACTEEQYIILGPEEENFNSTPYSFWVSVTNITDTGAELAWTVPSELENNQLTYDLAINDSVIAYDITGYRYILSDLLPNSEYNFSVVAYDIDRNFAVVTDSFRTMKSFIGKVITFNLEYEYFTFQNAIETSDDGILMQAYVSIKGYGYHNVLIKLNSELDVEWEKNIGLCDENPVSALYENSDGSYIVILKKSIVKIDLNGNIQWTYNYPIEYEINEMKTAIEVNDGNILLAGFSQKDLGEGFIKMKYFILALTPAGVEIWHKYGGTTKQNLPYKIIELNDGNLMVFGTAATPNTEYEGYFFNSYWLLKLDHEGNFLHEYIYPNNVSGSDIPQAMFKYNDGLFLFGTATGYFEYGYSSSIPRITKLDSNGNIIWEKYDKLNLISSFPSICSVDNMDTTSFLIFSNDYSGISLVSLDLEGNIGLNLNLNGFSNCILAKYTKDGNYLYVSNRHIIVFNSDGYFQ